MNEKLLEKVLRVSKANNIALKRLPLVKRFRLGFIRDKYTFPVVYTDGTISNFKLKENELPNNAKPYGIVVANAIIPIDESKHLYTASEAEDLCKKLEFAGIRASLPNFNVFNDIAFFLSFINKQLTELGGVPFSKGWYRSFNRVTNKKSDMDKDFVGCYMGKYASLEEFIMILPADYKAHIRFAYFIN